MTTVRSFSAVSAVHPTGPGQAMTRLAGFPPEALAAAKRLVEQRTPSPPAEELVASFAAISDAIGSPEAQRRMKVMESAGWGRDSTVERDHPAILLQLANGGSPSGEDGDQ